MLLHASKLSLPPSAAAVAAAIFDPSSRSVALILSDSSALLFPLFDPNSISPLSSPIRVPAAVTAVAFLRLLPSSRLFFLSASPAGAGAAVLLRAWSLHHHSPAVAPANLSFGRQTVGPTLTLPARHGIAIRLVSTTNILALHLPADSQIWIIAAKESEGDALRLMKCAVIECSLPIYSMVASLGFLILGEVGGVRVFPLRALVKGRENLKGKGMARKSISLTRIAADRDSNFSKKRLPNGFVAPKMVKIDDKGGGLNGGKHQEYEGTTEQNRDSNKLKPVKLGQNSGSLGSFYISIRSVDIDKCKDSTDAMALPKVVSIHALPNKKFMILDDVGELHLLRLHDSTSFSETTASTFASESAGVYHINNCMRVRILSVLPDASGSLQVAWISDGLHTVHVMSLSDIDSLVGEYGRIEKSLQMSATHAIFTGERILDMVPLAASSILIIEEGSLFVYEIV